MLIIFIILLGLFIYSLFEFRNVKTKYLTYQDFKLKKPIKQRIIFISDFQYDGCNYFLHKLAVKIVNKINKLKGDIIILGGDYIQRDRKNNYIFDYIKQINGYKIGVLGNHDYDNVKAVKKQLIKANVNLLVNKRLIYNDIEFIGLDDYLNDEIKYLKPTKNYSILITHNPDSYQYLKANYSLILSGHTHGGQITLFNLYAPVLPIESGQKYKSGLIKVNKSIAYISKGLGGMAFNLPIRFFARPEIVVIDL